MKPKVIGAVRDERAAVDTVNRLSPDVLVLDVLMPCHRRYRGGPVAAGGRLSGEGPSLLTVDRDPDHVNEALAAFALGSVVKGRLAPSDPLPSLRDALAARSFVSPSMSQERTRSRES